MKEESLKKLDEFVDTMLQLLIEARSLFPTVKVSESLLREGLTEYKGAIVPINSVSHRYLYDFYESNFLDAYILLFKQIFQEKKSKTSEFTFRTLLEMGVEESFILYDKSVENNERSTYILIKTLVDYFSIESTDIILFSDWFKKLFDEHKSEIENFLSEKNYQIILNMLNGLGGPFDDKFTGVLVDGRQLSSSVKSNMLHKYGQKKIFKLTDEYKRIKSGEAHTLHGNTFFLNYLLAQQTENNHLFRVYAHLTISGNDILKKLSDYLDNQLFKSKVTKHLLEFDTFRPKFNAAWESKEL